MQENLLEAVKANTTIDGNVYAVPHQWGTSGLVVDKTKAPDVKGWGDLCNPEYKGRTSMRLRRTILLGMAFSLGKDPFALYSDRDAYQKMLDEVTDKMIACKDNVKTYWNGGDDLSTLLLSGEVVASEAWDSTAFKLYGQNNNLVYVPPETGALAWIDTFAIPRKGKADDAAYKWINFVMRPDIVKLMSDSTGAISRSRAASTSARRQEGGRQGGIRRQGTGQPEILRQYSGRTGRHRRQGAGAHQGGLVELSHPVTVRPAGSAIFPAGREISGR